MIDEFGKTKGKQEEEGLNRDINELESDINILEQNI